MEYTNEQGLALARIKHKLYSAEKRFFARRLEETIMLRNAMDSQTSELWRRPQNQAKKALNIARASRDALSAEKRLFKMRVAEAELQLRLTQEAAEAVDSKLRMADQQVGRLMNKLETQGYLSSSPVGATSDLLRARLHKDLRNGSPSVFDGSSDSANSGLESYYDAPSD